MDDTRSLTLCRHLFRLEDGLLECKITSPCPLFNVFIQSPWPTLSLLTTPFRLGSSLCRSRSDAPVTDSFRDFLHSPVGGSGNPFLVGSVFLLVYVSDRPLFVGVYRRLSLLTSYKTPPQPPPVRYPLLDSLLIPWSLRSRPEPKVGLTPSSVTPLVETDYTIVLGRPTSGLSDFPPLPSSATGLSYNTIRSSSVTTNLHRSSPV